MPAIVFSAFEGDDQTPIDGASFKFDPHSITSVEALRMRTQVSAGIRYLTLLDDYLQALAEFAIREMANEDRKAEMYKRSA